MRCGKWMAGLVVGFGLSVVSTGCVSLDDYRVLQAKQRQVIADKEALEQELYDMRNGSSSLQTRLSSMERELSVKDELVSNLRDENNLLDEMRQITQKELEGLANKQTLSPITLTSPRLPQPLDNALKRFANEHPTEVSYDARSGSIKWKSDLLFAPGSDVIKNSSKTALRGFSEIIKSQAAGAFDVIVTGHTDATPIKHAKTRHPTNWHLSAHRAISVANVLMQNGFSPDRTGVMGWGEFRPIAENKTKQGQSQNRRVEMFLVPHGTIGTGSAMGNKAKAGKMASVGMTD